MQLSSRNQLPATIRGIKLGNVMAEVVMEIDGGHEVVSAITGQASSTLASRWGNVWWR
jgi:molybdopterin-binding protein